MGYPTAIAVMIVTDHPIMRDGLRLRVQHEADMRVVCMASNLSQTLQQLDLHKPDVVLIDLQLPRDAGARAVSAIRRISVATPLVILTDDPQELETSPRAGEGPTVLVSKILTSEQLIPAIHRAVAATGNASDTAPA